MKFLHISDIHFDPVNDGRATRDLRGKFKEYIYEKGICGVDEVFFTGDFRHAGRQIYQQDDLVAENAVNFLRDIAESVGIVSDTHIHIVPGNHDLKRFDVTDDPVKNRLLKQKSAELLQMVYENYEKYMGRFEGMTDGIKALSYLRSRFVFFEKCASLLNNEVWKNFNDGLIHRVRVYDDYGIIYLNTAIASGRDSDRHNLLIGTDDFDKAVRSVGQKPIIILAHNPLSHLDEDEKNTVKNILKDNKCPVLWFCGDAHETQYDNTYNIACITAGCMVQERGTEASFFVGEFREDIGVQITAHGYVARHGYWQPEEAVTKRVRESIPEELKPQPCGELPINNLLPRNEYFTGRSAQLKRIADIFKSKDRIVIRQTVFGLGGIGKTQLAREYAYRYASEYSTIVWEINAESEETVFGGFSEFARILDFDLPQDFNEEQLGSAVREWMQENSKWLVIFDNLDFERTVSRYLPQNNIKGHILVTTRNTMIGHGETLEIDVFLQEEALAFLCNRLSNCRWLENDAAIQMALVERLGCLPLALEQAAAYILNNPSCNYGKYLLMLEQSGLEVFQEEASKPEYYEKIVVTTWSISYKALSLRGAKQLFNMCAYMGSENIPIDYFVKGRNLLPAPLKNDVSKEISKNRILKQLHDYSLVKVDTKHIHIHRLVQEVVRKKHGKDTKWCRFCIGIIHSQFHYKWGDEESMRTFYRYVSHAIAVTDYASKRIAYHDGSMVEAARLLSVIGYGFRYSGMYQQSLEYYKKAYEIRREQLGERSSEMATICDNIASTYEELNDHENALLWYEKDREITEILHGKDSISTAYTYNNMAVTCSNMGQYKKSIEYLKESLVILRAVLQEDDPDIATAYNNIAMNFDKQGQYDKALEWYKKDLAICEKKLGVSHPDTAVTYNNIGMVYYRKGDNDTALEWYKKALRIYCCKLGMDHPKTQNTLFNANLAYHGVGKTETFSEWIDDVLH
ncbi:photosystem I assembly protein Ycf3 [Lachnospiraceae bacterium]|nr:photosystem I assembly protein Ycf3 [Lachnospiraceae bacterium]